MIRRETPSYPISIFMAGDPEEAFTDCAAYCDAVGMCVTVMPTTYVYTGGSEVGVIIGLINYPRFPSSPEEIWAKAEALAARLCAHLGQQSYTIQAPDKTVWISHREQTTAETSSVEGDA